MEKWQCIQCGYIYHEAEGCPEEAIPPETAWAQVPEDWICPDCGATKNDFERIE
jgi:rubredoxin